MRNSPEVTEWTEKTVRPSESSRYRSSRYRTDLQGKLMKMLKEPNKKFVIVKFRDSGYSR